MASQIISIFSNNNSFHPRGSDPYPGSPTELLTEPSVDHVDHFSNNPIESDHEALADDHFSDNPIESDHEVLANDRDGHFSNSPFENNPFEKDSDFMVSEDSLTNDPFDSLPRRSSRYSPPQPAYQSPGRSTRLSPSHNQGSQESSSEGHPPDSCKRIGRYLQFVLWSVETHDDFVTWWWTTSWFQKNYPTGSSCPPFRWKSSNRTSPYWDGFHQAAKASDGQPHIVCKNCHDHLVHPLVRASGTKALSNHLSSTKCQRSTRGQPSATQQKITDTIRRMVSY